MLKKLTKEELERLRSNLPKDGVARIAEATGLKNSSIKKILQEPARFNKQVIEKALEIAEEESEEFMTLRDKLNNLPTKK